MFNPIQWFRSLPTIFKSQREQAINEWETHNVNITSLPSVFQGNIHLLAFLKLFKSAYTSRFIYSKTDKLDTFLLEELLWFHGKCAVVNYDGKVMVGTFIPTKMDHNNNPELIKFFTISQRENQNKTPLKKVFKVGENAVIIRDDRPNFTNSNYILAPYITITSLLPSLIAIQKAIFRNVLSNRPIIPAPALTSEETINTLNNAVMGGDTFIAIGGSMDTLTTERKVIDIPDRTTPLWENYNNYYNHIKDIMGFDSNPLPNRRERESDSEVQTSNTLSQAVLSSKLKTRQMGLLELKKVFNLNIVVKLEKEEKNETIKEDNNNQNTTDNPST